MLKTEISEGIALVSIDLPGRAMNVMDWPLVDALDAEFARLAADPAVSGIILTSAKAAFMAGADLAMLEALTGPPRDIAARVAPMAEAFRRMETCGKPIVAAAPGTALGAGLELMLACHARIAADAPGAVFGLPEIKLGLFPGAGGTQRLPRLIGIEAALPLLLEGRALSPAAALKAGLLDALVPADDLIPTARRMLTDGRVPAQAPWDKKGFSPPGGGPSTPRIMDAFSLANGKTQAAGGHLLPALPALLSCVYEGLRLPIDLGLRLERKLFGTVFARPEPRAMIRTLFFAKQAADKLARRPAGLPRHTVKRLGLIGTGFMGRGIAEVAALAGMDVVLLDRDAASAEAGRAAIADALDAQVARGRLAAEQRDAAVARLCVGAGFAALKACDLVIEAAPEEADLKARIIRAAEAEMAEDAVFATNTSALPLASLAPASAGPQRMVGLHFFSPVPRMALVEVVRGAATSDDTLARALDFVAQIRKTPILVNDGFGFYTSRCVVAFIQEGLRLLAEGTPPALIENAAMAAGMPVGPLALADEIGIDVLDHIRREAPRHGWGGTGPDAADGVFDALMATGRHGRKAGAGLYTYGQGGKHLWEGLAGLVTGNRTAGADETRERLIAIQCVTAAGAFAEGIVTDTAEADLGAVLGWAFPAPLGGPFATMERDGLAAFIARTDALAAAHGPRFHLPEAVRTSGFGQRAA